MTYKKFIFGLVIGSVAITTLFCSCEKKEFDNNKDLEAANSELVLKNGALSFQTTDAFFETSEKLGTLSDEERQNWENSIGFVSLRTELINIFTQIDEAEDENTVKEIVANNSDILEFVDGEVCPIIKSNSYAAIVNRKGIFFVEGVIHKVESGKIAYSEDGNEQTVTNALLGELKSDRKDVNVIEYINSSQSRGCGSIKTAYVEKNKKKCDFRMRTYTEFCAGCCDNFYYRVMVECSATNYKKKFGFWKKYKTNCTMKEMAYTIKAPIVTGYNGKHSVFHYENIYQTGGTIKSIKCKTAKAWGPIGDKVQNIGINAPYFIKVKGKATNDGVGGEWADINCGNW